MSKPKSATTQNDKSQLSLTFPGDAGPTVTRVSPRKRSSPKKNGGTRRSQRDSTPVTAEKMASQQREISVSEFFAKNRHLLGFDNKRKSLLTTVKEAVDNSLDACEEARILPDLFVDIEQLEEDRFRVTVRDNGPGIVKSQIPNIFGKLLYGSKFHRLKMCRGQQGIGISAAGMYGLITTGKPVSVVSRTSKRAKAHHYKLAIDTKKNRPDIVHDDEVEVDWAHGTEVEIELVASYGKGRQGIDEYLEQTAIVNPHAEITYQPPIGERIVYARGSDQLPVETREIKPHPHGIELGILIKMLKETQSQKIGAFLKEEFSRVSPSVVKSVCEKAKITPATWVRQVDSQTAEKLYKALQEARIMAPSTDCLAPVGADQLLAGLLKGIKAEFYTASTRSPTVYRGNPFQVEVGLAYGGEIPADQLARCNRFANRVPLLYQQSHCAVFKSVAETNWRLYGMQQSSGALPSGPLIVVIHFASVWVPFTSESKEAIADYDEIRKEIGLGLRECGRKLNTFIRRRKKTQRESQRRSIFLRYIPEVSNALQAITGRESGGIREQLQEIAKYRTELADREMDDRGNIVRKRRDSLDDEHTVIVERDTPTDVDDSLFEGDEVKRISEKGSRAPRAKAKRGRKKRSVKK